MNFNEFTFHNIISSQINNFILTVISFRDFCKYFRSKGFGTISLQHEALLELLGH